MAGGVPETFFSSGEQAALFLGSVLLGAVLGAVFDVFRVIRIIFPCARKKTAVMICDIIYMLISGAAVFFYAAVYGRAEVRFFFAAGAFLGAVLFSVTAGSVITSAARHCRDAVRKALYGLYERLVMPIRDKICLKCMKIKDKFVKCSKMSSAKRKKSKNLLKSSPQM